MVSVLALFVVSALLQPLVTHLAAETGALGAGSSVLGLLALLISTAVCVRLVDRRGWDTVWMGRRAARPGVWVEGWLLGALAIGVPSLVLV
ncbi:MAG: hypothetical protein ACRENQ_17285, partial [Gemmatimonadaceae bacterium]